MNYDKELRTQVDQTIDHDDARTRSLEESLGSIHSESSYKGDVIDDSELPMINTSKRLGLKLKITKSFVSSYQNANCNNQNAKQSPEGKDTQCSSSQAAFAIANTMKASKFAALHIRIGSWTWSTSGQEDFVAKLYYKKRKLIWEFLKELKYKIEIQWSDISAIRATFGDPGQQCSLDIELNQPPVFYKEIDPQPRKHTNWQLSMDFTDGQAPNFRRHHVIFPAGVLDEPFQRLMDNDERLFKLSQKPFPSQASPHFCPRMSGPSHFAPNFNGLGPAPSFNGVGPAPKLGALSGQLYQITSRGSPNSFTLINSSESGSSLSNEGDRNHQITTPVQIWDNKPNFNIQGPSNNNETQSNNITQDNMFTSPNYPSSVCYREVSLPLLHEMNFAHNITRAYQSNGGLSNNFNSLMEDSQIKCHDERSYLPELNSSLSLDDSKANVNNHSTNNSVMRYGFRDTNLATQNAVNNAVRIGEPNQITTRDPIVINPNPASALPWDAAGW